MNPMGNIDGGTISDTAYGRIVVQWKGEAGMEYG